MSVIRLLAAGAILLAVGCVDNDQSVDAEHTITDRFVSSPIAETETRLVESCESGSVLLGAGYEVHTVDQTTVSIRSSRPLGGNSWELNVYRGTFTPPHAVSVSLHVHCLHRTDGQAISLSSQAIQGGFTSLPSTVGVRSGSADAECPHDQVLTAGGFETILGTPDPEDRARQYSSWIDASLPAADRTSWRVQASYFLAPPSPRFRAYALCVRDPNGILQAVQAADADAVLEHDVFYDVFRGSAQCGRDNFSSGGGFEFHTEPVIPHMVLENRSGLGIGRATWRGTAFLGAEVANTPSPLMTVRPLCFAGVREEPMMAVDLFPLIGVEPLASQGCPSGANPCLVFSVVNAGTIASPATNADVFIPGASPPVRVNVPSLEPGGSVQLAGHYTAADLCQPNCSLVVVVDPDDVVDESQEMNNRATLGVVP